MTTIRFPHLEPTAGLEWAEAVEQDFAFATAACPADARRAWIHRADERAVVRLYRATRMRSTAIPCPWWLRALAAGRLRCRNDGFRVEDRIHALLGKRSGWEYVPWAVDGESGYWEFAPSERGADGHRVPTTVSLTDRHDGWIEVLAAHSGVPPEPAVANLRELKALAAEFEVLR